MNYPTLSEYLNQSTHYMMFNTFDHMVQINRLTRFFEIMDLDKSIADRVTLIIGYAHLISVAGNLNLSEYLSNVPEGRIISFMAMGDQTDYETVLRPVLQEQKEYFNRYGKHRNFFFFDLSHKVDESFVNEFKDVASFWYDPMFSFALFVERDSIQVENFHQHRKQAQIKKHFLSMNARSSWDRQALLYFLSYAGILDKCYFSYLCENSDRSGNGGEFDKLDQIIGNPWYTSNIDREKIKSLIPYTLDSGKWTFNQTSTHYIDESLCSIVLETHHRTDDPIFTEKILKPLGYGHPFLLFASNDSLTQIKRLGFETYGCVFDESYDNIKDPQLRLEQIFKEIQRISEWSLSECENVRKKVQSIVNYNTDHYCKMKNEKFIDYVQPYAEKSRRLYKEKIELLN